MTALWILLAALLVVLRAGLGCFALACARRPQPDMADPAVLKQSKYAPLADEILSGIAFWRAQEPEDIFLPSFDGLRLHGQLVQQPESKGTILLFHGYRSSWAIDFSIVLPYYYSLGYDLLVVDERAHGQSEGDYITFGVHERRDVVTWAQYAAMHFGPAHPLILDGLSMGAATVMLAAPKAPPSRCKSSRRSRKNAEAYSFTPFTASSSSRPAFRTPRRVPNRASSSFASGAVSTRGTQ